MYNTMNVEEFNELTAEESQEIYGGVVGTVCAVIGTAVYGLVYARGQAAGYKKRK